MESPSPRGQQPELHPRIELSGIAFQGEISTSDGEDPYILTDATADDDTDGKLSVSGSPVSASSTLFDSPELPSLTKGAIYDATISLLGAARSCHPFSGPGNAARGAGAELGLSFGEDRGRVQSQNSRPRVQGFPLCLA